VNAGLHRNDRGEDAGPALLGALEDYDAALARAPGHAEARWRRGALRLRLSRWAEAIADLEAVDLAAVADSTRERVKNLLVDARWRLQEDWTGPFREAEEAMQHGRRAEALAKFEEALRAHDERRAALPRDRLAAFDEAARPVLCGLEYNRACLFALSAAEAAGAGAGADAEEAGRLREDAFRSLAEAVRLGWDNAAHLEADTDLAGLRGDARWAALVEQVRGRGR